MDIIWDEAFNEWRSAEPELDKLILDEKGLSGMPFFSPYPRLAQGAANSLNLTHAPFLLGKCLSWYGWRTSRDGAEGLVKLLHSAASDDDATSAHEGAMLAVIDECFGATSRSVVGDVFRVTVNLHVDIYAALKLGSSYRIITNLISMETKGARRKFVMEALVTRADDHQGLAVMRCKSMFLGFVDRPFAFSSDGKDTIFGRSTLPTHEWVRYDISGRLVSPRTTVPPHEHELKRWEQSGDPWLHEHAASRAVKSSRPSGSKGISQLDDDESEVSFPFLYNRVMAKYFMPGSAGARSDIQQLEAVVGLVRFLGQTEGHKGMNMFLQFPFYNQHAQRTHTGRALKHIRLNIYPFFLCNLHFPRSCTRWGHHVYLRRVR
jgi:hypothetical protein